jgi:2-keto-4-pentenoate hydratase/2-oxohepta-3-ene-1,7-dioic acid hydratase in catechol pathway
MGKWFDKYAPIGPTIVSQKVVPNYSQLQMKSIINGEVRQSTKLDDMIFDIPALIRHLSRGVTLRKGTVVMTGTPSGVAAFMKPPKWLKHGDLVEIEIDKIGKMGNVMRFEK